MKKCFTRDGLKKLKEQLAYLEKEKRKEVAEKLKHAASFGDLSENSAYEDAKSEQDMLETQIYKLRETIKEAQILEAKEGVEFVQIGSRILVEIEGKKRELEIVGGTEADPTANKISCDSPMGKALLSKKAGEICVVQTPMGEKRFKILKIIQ